MTVENLKKNVETIIINLYMYDIKLTQPRPINAIECVIFAYFSVSIVIIKVE